MLSSQFLYGEILTDDFLLDVIGEIELPPTLSASSSPFLVTEDRSRGQLPLLINTGPHNNPRQFRYIDGPSCSFTNCSLRRNLFLSSGLSSPRRYQRARSQDRLLLSTAADAKEALSRSALNGRYFDEDKSNTAKSRSLDNLLRDEVSSCYICLSSLRFVTQCFIYLFLCEIFPLPWHAQYILPHMRHHDFCAPKLGCTDQLFLWVDRKAYSVCPRAVLIGAITTTAAVSIT